MRYFGDKIIKVDGAKNKLNENNAKDIYDGLKELKGSALKVAQMLSMEKNLLPQAYVDQFGLSQFSVPPLSAALVKKTIRKYLGADPEVIFDTFSAQSEMRLVSDKFTAQQKKAKNLLLKFNILELQTVSVQI